MEKIISFIIPVYNSEKYIIKCVESIMNQKEYKEDCEIILVDDKSEDTSGAICDELAKKNDTVKVYHNTDRGGICKTRNKGLAEAAGKWICFVDNDDIFDSQGLNIIRENLDDDCQIIYYGFNEFFSESNIVWGNSCKKPEILENEKITHMQKDCLCRYKDNIPVMSYRLLTTPWGKIYKHDFLNNNDIKFIDGLKREEDVTFNLIALAYCKKAKHVEYPIYHYRRFVESESHNYKINIKEDVLQSLKAYKDIISKLYKENRKMEELYEYRIVWSAMYCAALGPAHVNYPGKYSDKRKQFKEIFSENIFENAFVKCDISKFDFKHRILAYAAKRKNFFLVSILLKVENLVNKIKFR